ncbi:MAG: hypothetical protein JXA25_16200 [Anaerolineales bacterium]|nr:hypothetical protein [Anaerolineales bacterium]
MPLIKQGTGSIFDLCDDRILYRSLNPLDSRLPRFSELKEQLPILPESHPRKSDPVYGQICAAYIRRIFALEGKPEPENLLYFGDTLFNDVSAFNNIRAAGPWNGLAFIGRDNLQQPPGLSFEEYVASANRWSLLNSFLKQIPFPLDERTVLVLDLDKTALGARGRNDSPINQARVEAMQQTIQSALKGELDRDQFRVSYDTLNQTEFHPFTGDNQDYLAYLCLIIIGGALRLETLVEEIRSGGYSSFPQFLKSMQENHTALEEKGLAEAHDTVWQAVQQGDPTPYKEFRKAEFLATLDRFTTNQSLPVKNLLEEHIILTAEVYQTARQLRQQGVVVLGISDKPDISSLPDEAQAKAGLLPIHKQQTLIVGEDFS